MMRTNLGVTLIAAFAAAQPINVPAQKSFPTPDDAAKELIQAAGDYNVPELLEILGPDSKGLVSSDDPTADRTRAQAFAALAREKVSIVTDTKGGAAKAQLLAGNESWPFPVPLVKKNEMWVFDTKAGRQEILFRRIGENELDAIQICRGYVEAQKEYALEKHDGINQYAQRLISSPGKQDGLAWQNPDGTWGGPIGESVAKAIAEGYAPGQPPYHGYYFKVLKGQGPGAPLGAMDFVVEGMMIGGFALAAAPAQYKISGVQTFIVSHEGIVYQKDL